MREPDEPDGDILLSYLDPSFGTAIAMAISEWARFEYRLDQAIWELAEIEPEIGACITCQLPTVVSRFNALIALTKSLEWNELEIKKITKLQGKSQEIADKRNRVVHDPWFIAYKSGEHYRLQKTAKGKLEYIYKAVTIEELESIKSDSLKLSEQLDIIFREHYSANHRI